MNKIIGNAIRNVKDFFVEPVSNFSFEELIPHTFGSELLFDPVAIEPTTVQSQSGNQEAVLNAFERAVENYYLGHIAPLLRNVVNLRWQIKQIQLRETADNTAVLMEINRLSPSILNAISKAILKKLPCFHAMDLSQFYGVSIVPESELIGRSIVMWASVGQEKTAINFCFDDEIIEGQEEAPMLAAPAAREPAIESIAVISSEFHLKLIDPSGEREIKLTQFPAIVGNSPRADIQVVGEYVSGQHLVLHWDDLLQCVYLLDRSKHGTYLGGGRKLADGDRFNLLGAGSFQLTQLPDAPRFDYWHGAQAGKGTSLLPPEAQDIVTNLESFAKANTARHQTEHSQPASKAKSLREVKLHSAFVKRSSASTSISTGATLNAKSNNKAQPTALVDNSHDRPLAWLQVRNAQKQVETVAITSLPFCIGREFDGEGYAIDEAYVKVSRNHLRILEQRGSVFGVYNNSPHRPGQSNITVGEKGAESHHFVWIPQQKNSNGGWRVLGSNRLDAESIEVRLLAADSLHHGQS